MNMKNKKVLIAGGAGYLGGHVSEELTSRGYEVLIYDLKAPAWLRKEQRFIQGDLSDLVRLNEVLNGVDVVYNFASIADIGEAKENRLLTLQTNIIGCANLLEASVNNKVKKFIQASTVYVYSNKGSFYRISKHAAELLVEEYAQKFGFNYVILRYGSLYGGRAQEWNGLRRYVEQIMKHSVVTLKTNGLARREYIHALDAARMSVDILDDSYSGKSILLTGTQTINVKELVGMIAEILDQKVEIEFAEGSGDHYELTPYKFQPRMATKLTSNEFIDFGQGILEVIHQVSESSKFKEG
jgi:UDP-glucose 4-epimerase